MATSASTAGRRVFVTGAAGGIGGETVRQLRALGHQVVGGDLRTSDTAEVVLDVTDAAGVEAGVAQAVARLGGLDVLVNGAGVGWVQDSGSPLSTADGLLDVNLLGPWRVTAAAMPALLAPGRTGRPRVVTIASGLSAMTVPFAAAYCASKAGVVAWSRVLRQEYGDVLDVHTVHPGYVRTAIHQAGAEAGIGLEGRVRADSLEATARSVVRAATSARAPRQVTTNAMGRVLLVAAQAAPNTLDRLVRAGFTRDAARRELEGSGLARPFLERVRAGRVN